MLISERVTDLMKNHPQAQGKTQNEIAAEMGIASSVLTKLLSTDDNKSKSKNPSSATIYAIATYFGVSADWLLGIPGAERTTDKATKELCAALGLSDLAIQYLQDENNQNLRRAVNFLFEQHHIVTETKEETIYSNRAVYDMGGYSIIQHLSYFMAICESDTDITLDLDTDGEAYISFVGQSSHLQKIATDIADVRTHISLRTISAKENINRIGLALETIAGRKLLRLMPKYYKLVNDSKNSAKGDLPDEANT